MKACNRLINLKGCWGLGGAKVAEVLIYTTNGYRQLCSEGLGRGVEGVYGGHL